MSLPGKPLRKDEIAASAITRPLRTGHKSKQQPRQQILALEEPVSRSDAFHKPRAQQHLWLAVYFENLTLETLCDPDRASEPTVVYDTEQGQRIVCSANESARSFGITAGLAVNAALALAPQLVLIANDAERVQQALYELASWAEGFTSWVSLQAPNALLLEVQGSLQLFGGLHALRTSVNSGLCVRGHQTVIAVAPTPLAAYWLAKTRQAVTVTEPSLLAGALSTLALHELEWPEKAVTILRSMGVATLGECRRLPRDGFTRRFGAAQLLAMDRAFASTADPRPHYRAPQRFSDEYDLGTETSDVTVLLQAALLLLKKLERFLLTRQAGVHRLRLSFFHLRRCATPVSIAVSDISRDALHWYRLLEVKIERLALREPAIAVGLSSDYPEQLTQATALLPFSTDTGTDSGTTSYEYLLERLKARLGDKAIRQVHAVAEHRPQYAWRDAKPGSTDTREIGNDMVWPVERPLWILPEPKMLDVERNYPIYQGRLNLLTAAERIESGWWDGADIVRDYYVASNKQQLRLWVFRDRKATAGQWYLHGVFG